MSNQPDPRRRDGTCSVCGHKTDQHDHFSTLSMCRVEGCECFRTVYREAAR